METKSHFEIPLLFQMEIVRALFPLCYAGNWMTLKSSILNLRLSQAGHSKFRYVVVAVKSQ